MFSRRIFFFAAECIWKAPSRAKFNRNQIYRGKHTRKSYGTRYLDPKYSRWISTDPALGEYIPAAGKANAKDMANLPGMGGIFNHTNAGLFHYAGNNPVRYIDPDGNYINLRNTHEENHEYILKMINKMSILQYKIVDGKMKIDAGIINHYGSETFNRDMLYAFCSDFDISVLFAKKVPAYVDKETPGVYGGTCYFFDKSKKAFIILHPDESKYPIIKTKNGKYSFVKRNEVFAHELSGHMVPMIKGKNGNAVSIENEIRRQMGLDEREEEPDHASF